MSNTESIQSDIQWLEQLFHYRWDFLKAASYSSGQKYIQEHKSYEKEYLYQPMKFSLVRADFEEEMYAPQVPETALVEGVYVYRQPGELYKIEEEYVYTSFFITPEDDWELVSVEQDWVLVTCVRLKKPTPGEIYDFKVVPNPEKTVWLPREYTNIPAGYHQGFTWEEFETKTEYWTEAQKKLVHQNLTLKDRVAFFQQFYTARDLRLLKPPLLDTKDSPYARFIQEHQLSIEDRILLILVLVNQIQPDFLLSLLKHTKEYPDLGGVTGRGFKGFLPTGETYLFLMGGRDTARRAAMIDFLMHRSVLLQQGWVSLMTPLPGEPIFSGVLGIPPQKVPYFFSSNPQTAHLKFLV